MHDARVSKTQDVKRSNAYTAPLVLYVARNKLSLSLGLTPQAHNTAGCSAKLLTGQTGS